MKFDMSSPIAARNTITAIAAFGGACGAILILIAILFL